MSYIQLLKSIIYIEIIRDTELKEFKKLWQVWGLTQQVKNKEKNEKDEQSKSKRLALYFFLF